MLKKLFPLFFIFFASPVTSQILNVESLRKVTDTTGFSGSIGFDLSFKRDLNKYLELSSDALVQYKMNRHLILWKNDINFKNIEGNKFQNSGVTHLRYNYRFHPRVAMETFIQAQYNKVAKINFRGLWGIGPRIKLTQSEEYKIYFGTLLMYEHEELDDDITPVQREFRNSSYLSLSFYPTSRIAIISTTYYQPKFKNFKDYRISSESSAVVNLFSKFSLKTTYTFIYNHFPAEGIPRSLFEFKTGVVYIF